MGTGGSWGDSMGDQGEIVPAESSRSLESPQGRAGSPALGTFRIQLGRAGPACLDRACAMKGWTRRSLRSLSPGCGDSVMSWVPSPIPGPSCPAARRVWVFTALGRLSGFLGHGCAQSPCFS